MVEKRVVVWVQQFKDRPNLMLQWTDPETGRRKSRSAGTCDPKEAEAKRSDLEYELNNGRYQEASRMTWEHFRGLFEATGPFVTIHWFSSLSWTVIALIVAAALQSFPQTARRG